MQTEPGDGTRKSASRVSVAVVSTVRVVREGVAALLAREAGITVQETVASLRELVGRSRCAVVLVDSATARPGDVRTSRYGQQGRAVVFGLQATDGGVAWIAAGAVACLPADVPARDLAQAAQTVARGEIWCALPVVAALLHEAPWTADRMPLDAQVRLTPQEHEILALLAQGRNARQIAATLSLPAADLSRHVRDISRKVREIAAARGRASSPAADP